MQICADPYTAHSSPIFTLEAGSLHKLLNGNPAYSKEYSYSDALKAFAKHNKLFRKEQYVDEDSSVFLITEYETVLLLSNTLPAERIYICLVG